MDQVQPNIPPQNNMQNRPMSNQNPFLSKSQPFVNSRAAPPPMNNKRPQEFRPVQQMTPQPNMVNMQRTGVQIQQPVNAQMIRPVYVQSGMMGTNVIPGGAIPGQIYRPVVQPIVQVPVVQPMVSPIVVGSPIVMCPRCRGTGVDFWGFPCSCPLGGGYYDYY